ncbi:MAG: terminase small subunit [Anaerolineae bacterium]|nr:terminase small subunit [Anaerolineae bacterium]
MGLSNKRRVFVEEYLKCWNASEAARRAGYSVKNADVVGARLLVNVGIAEAIARRLSEIQMSTDEVLARLTEQARGSMADFINPETDTIDLVKAQEAGKLHLIKSFSRSIGKTQTTRIELYDAQAALVQIGRARGMFVDKIAPTDPSGEREYQPVGEEEHERAALELTEWRLKQIEALNGLNATLTRHTSSTPTG